MKRPALPPGFGRAVRLTLVGLGFAAVVVVLLLWLAGFFAPKIASTGTADLAQPGRPLGDATLVAVRALRVPAIESAVGTVRAVQETALASKLLAKVVEINARAGQPVKQGDVLVRLDDEDLKARVQQTSAAVTAADVAARQAQVELDRVRGLYEQNAAARIELDRVETAFKAATAELERSRQAQREAETNLGYATLTSPFDGVVIDKRVESGDTVTPGQTLLALYDPSRMQLVARVRESLIGRLRPGQTVGVKIESLGSVCEGQISEIVPESDVVSRTFTVKVQGPCPPEIHSGMFARLLIPLDEEDVPVIPQAAVRRVGQLELVEVADAGGRRVQRRAIRLGRAFGDDTEVLAGLRVGERVAVGAR